MKNKDFWKTLIQVIVTVLTALGTTLGVTSCMGQLFRMKQNFIQIHFVF